MRILLLNHIENARESLRSNRLRTFLTVIGITLGVACMTTILALSQGATRLIDDQVGAIGGNLAIIRPGASKEVENFKDLTSPFRQNNFAISPITEKDYTDIAALDSIKASAPLMSISGSISSRDATVNNGAIVATTPDLQSTSTVEVRDGQFIDSVTNENTAVVGQQLSVELFGTNQSIGKTFKIRGKSFTVIGILKSVDESINYNNVDFNNTALINLKSGKDFNQGLTQIRQINVQSKKPEDLEKVKKQIDTILAANHNEEKDYTILSGEDIARPTSQLFITFSTVTSMIALISLIIGGIGIMNIMLVSVAERTREIGIRKSVGASNGHIMMQFLIESLAMSVSGGVLGFGLGYVAAFLLSLILPFPPTLSWGIVGVSFAISIGVGTLFGLYPAIRAARKNPIEALRQYQ